MKSTANIIRLTFFALSLAALTIGSRGAPFQNGSFEVPALAPGGNEVLPLGSVTMTGWTVGGTGGAVGLQNGVVDGVSPVDGAQHIAFNGGDKSPGARIFQTFAAVVVQEYLVSFNVVRKGSGGGALSLLAEVKS